MRSVASGVANSVQPYGPPPARLLCPWHSPGKSTGVGCRALLQGIFPTQGSNLHLLRLLNWQAGSLLPVPPGNDCAHLFPIPRLVMAPWCQLEISSSVQKAVVFTPKNWQMIQIKNTQTQRKEI